jgi:hypothetical protein
MHLFTVAHDPNDEEEQDGQEQPVPELDEFSDEEVDDLFDWLEGKQ